MDWVAVGGLVTGSLALIAAALTVLYTRRTAVNARHANVIAEKALEAQRGPEFAFEVLHAPQLQEERVFRLLNRGWRDVSGVSFEPVEPGDTPWGSFTPCLIGTFGSMANGESVRFIVGVRDPEGREDSIAPAHILVKVRESPRVFRVDMPSKLT